jgi:hypothetical protein
MYDDEGLALQALARSIDPSILSIDELKKEILLTLFDHWAHVGDRAKRWAVCYKFLTGLELEVWQSRARKYALSISSAKNWSQVAISSHLDDESGKDLEAIAAKVKWAAFPPRQDLWKPEDVSNEAEVVLCITQPTAEEAEKLSAAFHLPLIAFDGSMPSKKFLIAGSSRSATHDLSLLHDAGNLRGVVCWSYNEEGILVPHSEMHATVLKVEIYNGNVSEDATQLNALMNVFCRHPYADTALLCYLLGGAFWEIEQNFVHPKGYKWDVFKSGESRANYFGSETVSDLPLNHVASRKDKRRGFRRELTVSDIPEPSIRSKATAVACYQMSLFLQRQGKVCGNDEGIYAEKEAEFFHHLNECFKRRELNPRFPAHLYNTTIEEASLGVCGLAFSLGLSPIALKSIRDLARIPDLETICGCYCHDVRETYHEKKTVHASYQSTNLYGFDWATLETFATALPTMSPVARLVACIVTRFSMLGSRCPHGCEHGYMPALSGTSTFFNGFGPFNPAVAPGAPADITDDNLHHSEHTAKNTGFFNRMIERIERLPKYSYPPSKGVREMFSSAHPHSGAGVKNVVLVDAGLGIRVANTTKKVAQTDLLLGRLGLDLPHGYVYEDHDVTRHFTKGGLPGSIGWRSENLRARRAIQVVSYFLLATAPIKDWTQKILTSMESDRVYPMHIDSPNASAATRLRKIANATGSCMVPHRNSFGIVKLCFCWDGSNMQQAVTRRFLQVLFKHFTKDATAASHRRTMSLLIHLLRNDPRETWDIELDSGELLRYVEAMVDGSGVLKEARNGRSFTFDGKEIQYETVGGLFSAFLNSGALATADFNTFVCGCIVDAFDSVLTVLNDDDPVFKALGLKLSVEISGIQGDDVLTVVLCSVPIVDPSNYLYVSTTVLRTFITKVDSNEIASNAAKSTCGVGGILLRKNVSRGCLGDGHGTFSKKQTEETKDAVLKKETVLSRGASALAENGIVGLVADSWVTIGHISAGSAGSAVPASTPAVTFVKMETRGAKSRVSAHVSPLMSIFASYGNRVLSLLPAVNEHWGIECASWASALGSAKPEEEPAPRQLTFLPLQALPGAVPPEPLASATTLRPNKPVQLPDGTVGVGLSGKSSYYELLSKQHADGATLLKLANLNVLCKPLAAKYDQSIEAFFSEQLSPPTPEGSVASYHVYAMLRGLRPLNLPAPKYFLALRDANFPQLAETGCHHLWPSLNHGVGVWRPYQDGCSSSLGAFPYVRNVLKPALRDITPGFHDSLLRLARSMMYAGAINEVLSLSNGLAGILGVPAEGVANDLLSQSDGMRAPPEGYSSHMYLSPIGDEISIRGGLVRSRSYAFPVPVSDLTAEITAAKNYTLRKGNFEPVYVTYNGEKCALVHACMTGV